MSLVYVGTYTYPGRSKGIYVYDFDAATGRLSHRHTVPDVVDPAFLALSPDHRHLYCVNWMKPAGTMSAFRIEADGNLTFLNRQPSGGADPCHLCVDPSGRCLLTAHHESGTVALLPIEADGRLAPPSDVSQHEGSGPRPAQAGPHAHCVNFDPAGEFFVSCDKGADKIYVYRVEGWRLVRNEPPFARTHAGAGPRHVAFAPDGRFLYVCNEQDSTVSVFACDADLGRFQHRQTLTSLPDGWDGQNTTSEIALHPSGAFLYVSNRGHDSIAIYAVDSRSGELAPIGHEPSRGETPRFFAIDPSGAWLFACNQDSDTIVTFRIDQASGALEATGDAANVPSPVCIVFAPA